MKLWNILRIVLTILITGADYFLLDKDNKFRAMDSVKFNKKTVLLQDRLTGSIVKRKVAYAIPADWKKFLLHPKRAARYIESVSNVNVPTYFVRDTFFDQWGT